MRTSILSSVFMVLTLALVFGIASPQPAAACTTCFCDEICDIIGDCCAPWCGGGENEISSLVTLRELDGNRAEVTVSGAVTADMPIGASCATGFQEIPGVATATSVHLDNIGTGEVIYTFDANEETTASFEDLDHTAGPQGGVVGQWQGFVGHVTEDVPDGIVTRLVIELQMEDGVSFRQLASEIERQGIIGAGSAESTGALDFHHVLLRGLGEMPFRVIPATSNASP